ncbi:MAG TPA: hypothetical protein VFV85_06495 [Conexibacter sp.]|nr:hypothetical protein [Conexibacter sp.]
MAAVLSAAVAASADAHQGNPNFRSEIRAVSPQVPGLQVRVLGFDEDFELTNRTGRTVVVYGYAKEPYVRLLPDGTVQTNQRSPAVYLNEDRYATTPVPPSAKPSDPPQWRTVDKTSRYVWHDHRMHWMSRTTPPAVKDKDKRTKIFDYAVPLSVGAQRGQIAGTLMWVGPTSHGFPVAAIVSLVVVLLLAVALVLLVRRRRADAQPAGAERPPDREAW